MKKLGENTTVPMCLAKENCAFDNLMFIELISLKKLNQKLEEQIWSLALKIWYKSPKYTICRQEWELPFSFIGEGSVNEEEST